MENKRGQSIFLGIVGVATLVVAIIGATFAYFSASISGDNEVTAEAYNFSASLVIDDITGEYENKLIPLYRSGDPSAEGYDAASNKYLLAAVNNTGNKSNGRCVDANGYQVCTLIRATFTNTGSAKISLEGSFASSENSFTNLKVAELVGNETTGFTALTTAGVVDAPKPKIGDANATFVELSPVEELGFDSLNDANKVVKYFVIYLEDVDDEQKVDMGKNFTGTFTYTSTVGSGKLTGTFEL